MAEEKDTKEGRPKKGGMEKQKENENKDSSKGRMKQEWDQEIENVEARNTEKD